MGFSKLSPILNFENWQFGTNFQNITKTDLPKLKKNIKKILEELYKETDR